MKHKERLSRKTRKKEIEAVFSLKGLIRVEFHAKGLGTFKA